MKKKAVRILAALGMSAMLAAGSVSLAWADSSVVVVPIEAGGTGTSQSGPSQNGPSQSQSSQSDSAQSGPSAAAPAEQSSVTQPETSQSYGTIAQPEVAAQGAALYNATTGQFLFTKNGDTQYYPASITKLMTALLVAENCDLDEIVTFSAAATTNLESGAVSLNLTEGDQLTVEQCLYGLLLKSANEIGNALAEHVAGSNQAFADLMNAKAVSLGCTNTHFTNPHGLNDSNHYTTPHDMALIGQAAFQNDTVRKVASTLTYEFPATKKSGARTITMGHKMLNPNDSRYYPGIIGGKTGYTSKAGNTLVTAVEQNGTRLIAVIMKSSSTHYTDTKALLDYGFELAAQQKTPSQSGSSSSETAASGDAAAGPGVSLTSGWKQEGTKWTYIKSNGVKAAAEWLTVEGKDYWFDADGYMVVGWIQSSDGFWYYLHSDGHLASNAWIEENGSWYYVGQDGKMMTSTTTPDGYRVDENGVWVQ